MFPALLRTCLLAFALASPLPAAVDGLRIRVDHAVPFRNPGSPSNRPSDLWIDLAGRPGQPVATTGWAWFSDLPEVEVPVTVTRQSLEGFRLRMDLKLEVPHLPPRFTGGEVAMTLDFALGSVSGQGDFQAQATGVAGVQVGDLWRASGSFGAPEWRGGLSTASTRSYTRLPERFLRSIAPVLARAEWREGLAPLPDRIPRIPVPMPKVSTVPDHPAWAELAGWLRAPTRPADAAAPLARFDARQIPIAQTPDICAALASAATLQAWAPGGEKAASARILAQWGRLAAGEEALDRPLRAPSPVLPGGWLAGFDGPEDVRLAAVRAAAGLALLAALPDLEGEEFDASRRALERCRRSVGRFLESAVGDRGAPTGAFGYADALEWVSAFGWWLKSTTGADVFAGSGWSEAGRFHATTDGLLLRRATPDRFWLVACRPGANPASLAALDRAAAQAPPVPATLWQAWLAALWPPGRPTDPASQAPRVLHDTRMGALALGSGWTPDDFLLVFEMGTGPGHGGTLPGQFVFRGAGWTWAQQTTSAPGAFGWPVRSGQNVFQAKQGTLVQLPAAEPTSPGRLIHLRARRDGSGMASVGFGGFTNIEGAIKSDSADPLDEEGQGWRTLGVDYSRQSGAAAALVIVEGAVGLGQRRRSWEMTVGDVPAARVSIQGPEFVVRPPGVKASLRGRFAYPDGVQIEYLPPADGRPGRVVAWLDEPQESNEDLLKKSMDSKMLDLQGVLIPDKEFGITVEDPMTLDDPAENEDERARRQREGKIVVEKIYRWTSSAKMGGGDRRPKAFGSLVVALTVAEGDHPEIEVAPAREDALLRIGGMPVWYRENQVWFGPEGF